MQDWRGRMLARVERVLRDDIRPSLYWLRDNVPLSAWEAPGEPVVVAVALEKPYATLGEGDAWVRAWGTTWFRLAGTVPAAWLVHDDEQLELSIVQLVTLRIARGGKR